MQASEPSTTAKMTAIARGRHRLEDSPPWVLDDPFALPLAGPEWPQIFAEASALFRPQVLREARGFLVGRSRYSEDRLQAGSFHQYVILGAGLDSFAWRRPDALRSLRVFEVDHPAMQAWKRDRAAVLALPQDENHIFAPVDFELDTLRGSLEQVGFDWLQPTMFSWLGVVAYLTTDAIVATLRQISTCAPGSEIVLSYPPDPSFVDEIGLEFRQTLAPVAGSAGEPFETTTSPGEMEELMVGCGLKITEHLTRDDLHDRYFGGRPDGLTPYTNERLLVATVPG